MSGFTMLVEPLFGRKMAEMSQKTWKIPSPILKGHEVLIKVEAPSAFVIFAT